MPRPHPPEFRSRAIELAREGAKPIAKIAEDLGISESCLRNWLNQPGFGEGKRRRAFDRRRHELSRLRREDRVLKMEERSWGEPRPSSPTRAATARADLRLRRGGEGELPVVVLCRTLQVSTSGFYDWRARLVHPSRRQMTDEFLTELIKQIHDASRRTYGSPRVHAELRLGEGIHVGEKPSPA